MFRIYGRLWFSGDKEYKFSEKAIVKELLALHKSSWEMRAIERVAELRELECDGEDRKAKAAAEEKKRIEQIKESNAAYLDLTK